MIVNRPLFLTKSLGMILSGLVAGILCAENAQAESGLLVRSFSSQPVEMNSANIVETIYTGMCPGLSRSTPEAWFQSSSIPTGDGQRVRLENVSPGMNPNKLPFTDRGYEKGPTSEHTWLGVSSEHRGRSFGVQAGVNNIDYKITKGDQVVDSGSFQLNVQITQFYQPRNQECTWRRNCYPTPTETRCMPEWECRCPL